MLVDNFKETPNVISNEYIYSTNLLNCQSEFNVELQTTGPNEAEIRAMIEEKRRLEKEVQQKKKHDKNMNMYMANIRRYKTEEEQKKLEENLKKLENQKKLEEKYEYNLKIRQNNLNTFKSKSKEKKQLSSRNKETDAQQQLGSYHSLSNESKMSKESGHYTFKKSDENQNKLSHQNEIMNEENDNSVQSNENQQITVDISNTINLLLRQKVLDQTSKSKNSTPRDTYRDYHSNENIKKKIDNEIEDNLKKINVFRKKGLIPSQIPTPNITENTVPKKRNIPKPKFRSELEKKRYIKALKHIMTERLGEKKIIIPNICSCGQLQKKLEAIIEDGNFSVLKVSNFECANNCIYYKNPTLYNQSIKELVSIVKKLKYNSFNNKYKNY